MIGVSRRAILAGMGAAAVAPLLYPVANRTFVPNGSGGSGNTNVLALTNHFLFDDVNGVIEIWWPNWRATTGSGTVAGGAAEILPGVAATGSANITYIDATSKSLVTVNMVDKSTGSTSLTAPDGGYFKATATIKALKGTKISPKIAAVFPNGMNYAQHQADYNGGDVFQYGGSALPLSNTPTNTYTGTNDYYGPCSIRANTSLPSYGICGDSRNAALGDTANDAYGNIGQVARLIGKRLPYNNVSVPGETAADFAVSTQSPRRRELLAQCSAGLFIPLGTNDIIFQGRSAATTLTSINQIATDLGVSNPFLVTIDPATTGGITSPARPQNESARIAFNTSVRSLAHKYDPASVLESSSTPGAWADASYVSSDLTHESNVGNQYAADNAGFDFTQIGSPPVVSASVAYAPGAAYQNLPLDGFTGSGFNSTFTQNAVYSPEHKVTGAVIKEDTSSGAHSAEAQITLALAGTTRTYTFYAKRVSGTRNVKFMVQKAGGNYADTRVVVNLGTGTVIYQSSESGVQTPNSTTITAADDWWKIVFVVTYASSMLDNPYVFFTTADDTGSENTTGDNTSSIAVWGLDIR